MLRDSTASSGVSPSATQGIYGYEFPGVHFDVGTPLGLLKASVHTALQREDVSASFRAWLAKID